MDGHNFQLKIETAAGITEITQAAPETVTQKVNRLAREAGYNEISPYAIETIGWEGATSTTTIYNRNQDEAYVLNPIRAAVIRHYQREGIHTVPEGYTGPVGVHRAMISYGAMSRVNSVADLKITLQPVINTGIMDLINQFGNIMHGYKITMQMPGYEGTYFRDVDDAAAYEFRLFLYKE